MNKDLYKEHLVPGSCDMLVSAIFFLLPPFAFRGIHTKMAQKIQEGKDNRSTNLTKKISTMRFSE